jgi:hypothetical protein
MRTDIDRRNRRKHAAGRASAKSDCRRSNQETGAGRLPEACADRRGK